MQRTEPPANSMVGMATSIPPHNLDELIADWAPDVTWDVSGYRRWPGDRTAYVGPADILAAYAQFASTVEVLKVDLHEVTEVRPGRVPDGRAKARRAASPRDRPPTDGVVRPCRACCGGRT